MSPLRYPSEAVDAAPLAAPLTFPFSGRSAQNRFLKAAMTESLSSYTPENHATHGIPSPELATLYERWGVDGQYGQILTGNIMLFDNQLEGPGNMVIPLDAEYEGEKFEAFKEVAAGAKKGGSLIVGQLSHPGRQVEARVNPNPIGASDIPLSGPRMGRNFAPPRAATESDLKEIIAAFAHAAQFLEKAGFDGAELHGAHGYLIAQFLSLSTNNRTDAYGGSLQNRMRLLLEIAAAIKAVVSPSFVLGIKINSVEFENHGFQPEDAAVLVSELEKAEFDYVELSGGTYEAFGFKHARESSRKREGFFLDFAGQVVKPLSKTRAYITGGFKTVGAMVSALAIVDGIGLGRPVCHEIGFGKDVLEGKIAGAIKPGLDEQDFGATSGAAATNMRRVAEGKGVLDFSDEGVVKGFLETMAKMAKGAQSGVQEGGDVLVEVKA